MLHHLGSVAEVLADAALSYLAFLMLQLLVVEVDFEVVVEVALSYLAHQVDFALMCLEQKLDFGLMRADLVVVEACRWTCYVHSACTYCILYPILPFSSDCCPTIHWHPCFFSFLVYQVVFFMGGG